MNLRRLLSKRDTDMTQGNITRLLMSFALPMMLGLTFQVLYNTVDSIVVGKFVSKQALAAVGCNTPIINMIIDVFSGLSVGVNVVISQSYGARDEKQLSKTVHTTIAMTLLLSVFATIAGVTLAKPLLRLTKTADDVMPDAARYLTIYFSGAAGVIMYNMGSGILRAVGDSTSPVIFLMISATTNIALDLLFVPVLGMEVAGVAWATVISQLLSAALIVRALLKAKGAYRLEIKKLHIDRDVLIKILRLGLPPAIQNAVTSFSNVFVQSYINAFGSDAMAGWSAYNKLDSFINVPVKAVSMASSTFVAQCWGAKDRRRARKGANRALLISLGITGVLAAVYMVFARQMMLLFANAQDSEVLRYGTYFIRIITPFYTMIAAYQIFVGALRGVGNSLTPTVVMLCSFTAFRQIYLFVGVKLLGGGLLTVTLAYPLGWLLCAAAMSVFYYNSKLYYDENGMKV